MEENIPLTYSNEDVIERIVKLSEGLALFWSNSDGWAPEDAAKLMGKSRLDRQASLARMLRFFNDDKIKKEEGGLILAWTTLGSLTEGVLKLYLSVSLSDYQASLLSTHFKGYKNKDGSFISPDGLMLEKLRVFFSKEIFPNYIRKIRKEQGRLDIIGWISKVQYKRNSIHAFKHRDIGDFNEFFIELKNFLIFMRCLTDEFPYPDNVYVPCEK